jgi:hypothetical protein
MQHGAAINDKDDIVGWGAKADSITIMLYSGGTLVDLVPLIDNAEHWDFSSGGTTGINDRGEISGVADYDDGSGKLSQRAYILVPSE